MWAYQRSLRNNWNSFSRRIKLGKNFKIWNWSIKKFHKYGFWCRIIKTLLFFWNLNQIKKSKKKVIRNWEKIEWINIRWRFRIWKWIRRDNEFVSIKRGKKKQKVYRSAKRLRTLKIQKWVKNWYLPLLKRTIYVLLARWW